MPRHCASSVLERFGVQDLVDLLLDERVDVADHVLDARLVEAGRARLAGDQAVFERLVVGVQVVLHLHEHRGQAGHEAVLDLVLALGVVEDALALALDHGEVVFPVLDAVVGVHADAGDELIERKFGGSGMLADRSQALGVGVGRWRVCPRASERFGTVKLECASLKPAPSILSSSALICVAREARIHLVDQAQQLAELAPVVQVGLHLFQQILEHQQRLQLWHLFGDGLGAENASIESMVRLTGIAARLPTGSLHVDTVGHVHASA